ncbi:hypothetical protein GCM10010280_50980 [Streptomyces pilosus]|uniref:Uncharacterized protein n=1 Tax=Streptomyces pilosus TaxID=28893 RepID=A0A918BXP3_9ACTN|nr:hypothetical protein GCM10010280_50980 [Streptomyces pilosus]
MNRRADLLRRAVSHPVVRLTAAALLQAAASRLTEPGAAPALKTCACGDTARTLR